MRFVRSQKKNIALQQPHLWAAENKSRTERYRSKEASKLKKFLIEIGGRAPKDVLVNYQCFKLVTRHNSKLMPVAFISSDLEVSWMNADIIDDGVKEALGEYIADLE